MNSKFYLIRDFIFIVIFSFFLFLICCCSSKSKVLVKELNEETGSVGVQVDSVMSNLDSDEIEVVMLSSAPPKTSSKKDETIKNNSPGTYPVSDSEIDYNENIAQPASDEIKPNYSFGKISYSIPDTMEYLKQERVVLRIAKEEIDSIMLLAYGTPVKDSFVLVDNIRVGNIMSAELIDLSTGKSFEIKELSSKEQNIEEMGYTEWQWLVKPLKSGELNIKMVIKVVIEQNGKSTIKDIPVFEREIYIIAKPMKSIWVFIENYWQWIFTVLLIPIFKYLWGLRKKKEKEEK